MSQTENSNQVSLPVAGEHGSFSENIVKHGFLRPPDMFLTENSNQRFFPGGCNKLAK